MADTRLDSLSIQLQTDAQYQDKLKEEVGKVIENFSKNTISSILKNNDLSGDPMSGTVEAKRFANATIQAYGTARTARAGGVIKAAPVVVSINDDKEFFEEVEEKDLIMYGINGLIERRTLNMQDGMKRYYERKFFNEAVLSGNVFAVSGSTIDAKLESLIQKLEVVQNDFVDGVERSQMAIVLNPSTYGLARSFIDSVAKGNVETNIEEFGMFHGVLVFSSVYLPATVDYVIMVKGAVAQPIRTSVVNPAKIQFSDATGFGMFLYAGTKTVNDDLIFFAGTLGTATITSVYGGASNKSTITVTSTKSDSANDFYYLAHDTAVAAPTYGDAVGTTWTKMTLTEGAATYTFATETKIRVAEADASGRIIKVSAETTIVKTGTGD